MNYSILSMYVRYNVLYVSNVSNFQNYIKTFIDNNAWYAFKKPIKILFTVYRVNGSHRL